MQCLFAVPSSFASAQGSSPLLAVKSSLVKKPDSAMRARIDVLAILERRAALLVRWLPMVASSAREARKGDGW
eukprot:scaffold626_cov409-Prasinococcus_capsulatus_cf.AAC.20